MTGRRSPAQFVCFSTSQNTFPTGTERDFRPELINTSTNLNREYTRTAIYRLHKFNAFNTGVPPGDFTFDEARHHICGIVPAVSTEFPAVSGQMGIQFGPAQRPVAGKTYRMNHRRCVREDAGFLVSGLVKPLHTNLRR